jgi:FAD/FMN-containing dehydrogenase
MSLETTSAPAARRDGDAASRRGFLLAAGSAGAGLLLTGCGGAARPAVRSTAAGTGSALPAVQASTIRPTWLAGPSGKPTTRDWEALRNKLSSHDLSRPGQKTYSQDRKMFDPRFSSLSPQGIAYCRTPADVAACLSFVTAFAMPVRARSGGHSYAGWSSVNGGLVIDVSQMHSFSVGTGTVTVGTGTALIDFYANLAAHGLAVPGGSCPTVGIAGLALGGGVGVVSRLYGLTSDNLESVQIVTADGSVLTCDSSTHSDLYWACRGGGGGNFGVATSFTFGTHKLTRLVVFFLTWPWSQARNVVSGWQSWAPSAPDALWANLHLTANTGGPPSVGVGGTFVGSVSGATAQLHDLYDKVHSSPSSSFVQEESFLTAMLIEAGCSADTVRQCHTSPTGLLPRVPSYAKSDFFTRKLNAAGISALLAGIEKLRHVSGAAGGVGAVAFDAFGGALNKVSPSATAFVHRDSLFLAQYSTSWKWPGSARGAANQRSWLTSYYKAVHPHASGQAYQNYIDPDLANWQKAYYGANYTKLTQVKSTYDPHQLFKFPQSIPPA